MTRIRSTAPVDADGILIQALRLRAGGSHELAIGAASVRNSTAFDPSIRVIEVYATSDCRIRQGNGSVTALSTDSFLPSGHARLYSTGGDKQSQHTHIAVIQNVTSGTLYVSELE